MTGALVVEHAGEGGLLTAVLALDDYSHEADPDVGHRRRRSRTEIGTLLNQAKYRPHAPRTQEAAQAELTRRLAELLVSEPLLAPATALVAVPSTTVCGFSEAIAADLRHVLDIAVLVGRSLVRGGRAAKHGPVKRTYAVDVRLHGPVVVFDDIYESGASLKALAQAALAAGAQRCSGLVIARVLPK